LIGSGKKRQKLNGLSPDFMFGDNSKNFWRFFY
jgi:hypothetical protein